MNKSSFGNITAAMLLGDGNHPRRPRLLYDEGAWDDLRLHSPKPITLICDVFDNLKPETQGIILNTFDGIHDLVSSVPTRTGQQNQ